MKRTSPQDILTCIESTGIIPVFNHKNADTAKKMADALYEGGIRVFEFTNRGTHSLSVFRELVTHLSKYDDIYLGIGTIFNKKEVEDFIQAGADFIVSPALIPEVANYCNSNGIFWIPGCGSVTEVYNAKMLGAELIKTFPANVLGYKFISGVKSVLPDVKLMPTGGVDPNNEEMEQWFKSGVFCLGMGSQLFDKKAIERGNFEVLTKNARMVLQHIKTIKEN